MTYRIVHYINQFSPELAEKAGVGPESRSGALGGDGFQGCFGNEAEIVGTVICGDGFCRNMDEASEKILKMIADLARCSHRRSCLQRRTLRNGMRRCKRGCSKNLGYRSLQECILRTPV